MTETINSIIVLKPVTPRLISPTYMLIRKRQSREIWPFHILKHCGLHGQCLSKYSHHLKLGQLLIKYIEIDLNQTYLRFKRGNPSNTHCHVELWTKDRFEEPHCHASVCRQCLGLVGRPVKSITISNIESILNFNPRTNKIYITWSLILWWTSQFRVSAF